MAAGRREAQVNYQVVKGSGTLSSASSHQRRQRLCQHHAAPGGHRGRCAGQRMRRPGQPALPDLFRDCGAAFDAPAATSGRRRPDPSRRPEFSAGHRAGHRFSDPSPPGAGRERNFPGGGVASGDCAAAGFDRRNYHYQKSCRRSSCLRLGSSVLSDGSGLATLQPSTGATQGALVIQGTAAAGASVLSFQLQSLLPVAPSAPSGSTRSPLDGPVGSTGARQPPSRAICACDSRVTTS